MTNQYPVMLDEIEQMAMSRGLKFTIRDMAVDPSKSDIAEFGWSSQLVYEIQGNGYSFQLHQTLIVIIPERLESEILAKRGIFDLSTQVGKYGHRVDEIGVLFTDPDSVEVELTISADGKTDAQNPTLYVMETWQEQIGALLDITAGKREHL